MRQEIEITLLQGETAQGAELTTSLGAVGVPLVVEDAAETASRNGVSID